ncbi:adenylosuccinate lyase family protein [Xylophilus sp. GOD-11R]|uniref:class-II fumarase/aspartase family protein n=1 Tax=Xylophilus sp. GOD-11R TaxID=3089814 RepID=UPI00298D038B|nr:adenylosuccinate lyase family protein [Xylophilus sp. GOD-11R]WPB59253.1 adenylosuccinate lyase family protein [Xylophilus sp. GOD-11R]
MRRIFSDQARVTHFLQVALALAKTEAAMGIIPAQAYEEIARRSKGMTVNWERLRQAVEAARHPGLPFLDQLAEACGSAAEYLHWGSTNLDVTDTAFILQLREGLNVVERDALQVRTILLTMAEDHRSTVMIARTEGMHDRPTTFGFRCAVWMTELDRQLERLVSVRTNLTAGPFGGSTGTLAALGARGLELQASLMAELGLLASPISWFSARDRITEVCLALAMMSSTMANIARAIVSLTGNEIDELREPAPPGRAAMGSIYHGANAVGCELVLTHARMAAQNVAVAMESMGHDRDHDSLGHFKTLVMPQSFMLAHAAVSQMAMILQGLEIHPARMRQNIDVTRGLVMAESVMMALARKTGRRSAHRLILRACESAVQGSLSLREALLQRREITTLLSTDEIDEALDPAGFLGCGPQIVERMIAAARAPQPRHRFAVH